MNLTTGYVLCAALAVLGGLGFSQQLTENSPTADNSARFGSFGPEGPRLREQLWLVPGGGAESQLRATVFRPPNAERENAERLPLVIINHGTDETTRESVSMPVFYWLSRWFVERGYAVVIPQRRGVGATGGEFAEALDSCSAPQHRRAGEIAADDIEAVLKFMAKQPFVDGNQIFSVGVSTGGWASLALAARNVPGLRGVINFAGGRGGRAFGQPGAICAADQLIQAAGDFGASSRVPTLWLYAKNDSLFGVPLAQSMASQWAQNGGSAELHILPPIGADGHGLADDRAGWAYWGNILGEFLKRKDDGTESAIVLEASFKE